MTHEPLPLIDTHAHLDFPKFHDDFDGVLQRAWDAGLEQIVTIGASHGFDSNLRALEIAHQHPRIFATLGVHPHDARIVDRACLERIEALAQEHRAKVVAIGETGLDYHYDASPREEQAWAFRGFLKMSARLDLPVVIHTRDAEEDTIRILEEEGVPARGGILHCFSGSGWLAEQGLRLGLHVSFSGIVTFKSAPEIQEVARTAPLERVLVETDAPYLAPIPLRGKRNEPAYVAHTLRFIAGLRGMEPAALARATTDNARRLYGLPLPA
jgi:TatD DNase family protein